MKNLRQKAHDWLRQSEKYLKTDMVYLIKNGSWLTLGQGASSLISLVMAIAFAHLVPKEVYGNYKYLISLGGLLSTFSLTGVGTALARSATKGYDGTLEYDFWLNVRWSVLIFLGGLASALYYLAHDNQILGISFLITGSLAPFFSSSSLHGAYLSGKKDFGRTSLYNIYKKLLPSASLIITMLVTKNVIFLVLIYFVSNTLSGLYFHFQTMRVYRLFGNRNIDPDNLNYSKHLSLMNILGSVADRIDSILVFHFLGAVSLSIYTFATAIPEQIIGWVKNINTLAMPKMVAGDKDRVKKQIWTKLLRFFLLLVTIYILYYVFAPFVYRYLFPQYIEAINYSRLYAVMIILTTSTILATFLQSRKGIKEQYIMLTFSSLARIGLVTIFVIYYGIWGAIIGQLIAKFLSSLLTFVLARKF